ncbi:MAG: NAD(P)-dependent alcohol dehydrogenase [Acidobacteriia bacterium]|nr:NAD(P)-dependent alcohol dehydrogenase [Terriglobia bacterium]
MIQRNGPPEVLEVGDAPLPPVWKGHVLVRVYATSVNPVDCYVRQGGLRRFAGVPFPIVPGVDLSGVVEECGKYRGRFRPGDEVFAFIPRGMGAYAEFAACKASWLTKKPVRLSHKEAAVLPCVGLTALQGLRDKARLKAGQSVLIVGASGGVGTMAVQIARVMGAEVTAVCSTANVDLVRKLGAISVIDYTRQNPLEDSRRFDAVFDCVGSWTFWAYRNLLKGGGRHVGISCTRAKLIDSILSRLTPGRKSFQFHVRAEGQDLEQLATWVQQGKLKPVVSHIYPLAEIAAAHRQCESRRTVGKIAVTLE